MNETLTFVQHRRRRLVALERLSVQVLMRVSERFHLCEFPLQRLCVLLIGGQLRLGVFLQLRLSFS